MSQDICGINKLATPRGHRDVVLPSMTIRWITMPLHWLCYCNTDTDRQNPPRTRQLLCIWRAHLYNKGKQSRMLSHQPKISNSLLLGCTFSQQSLDSPLSSMVVCILIGILQRYNFMS